MFLRRLLRIPYRIVRFLISTIRAPTRQVQHLAEIREGVANLTKVTVQRQLELTAGIRNLTQVIDQANKRSGASDRQLQNAVQQLARSASKIEDQMARLVEQSEQIEQRTSYGEQRMLEIANSLSVPRSSDGTQREPVVNLVDKLVAGLDNQSELINRRTEEILAEQRHFANALTEKTGNATPQLPRPSTAPRKASMAMPQFSLSRPDPIADLAVTKEYAEYVRQFAETSPAGDDVASAGDLSVLYALVRKLAPTGAVALTDGAEIEAIARAMADNGKGTLGVFGAGAAGRRRAGSLSANASTHLDFYDGTVRKSALNGCSFGYVNASAKDGEPIAAFNLMIETLGSGSVIVVGGSADSARALVQKALAGNAGWKEIGAGASKPRPSEIRMIALMRN